MSEPLNPFRGRGDKPCPKNHPPSWYMEKSSTGYTRRCRECKRSAYRLKPVPSELERWQRMAGEMLEGECWLWTGALDKDGYGRFSASQGSRRAARRGYELLVGPVPAGMVMDHLCRTVQCVNPHHLEPVTNAENIRRGYSNKTCPGDHEPRWGTRVSKGAEHRYCLECHAESRARFNAKFEDGGRGYGRASTERYRARKRGQNVA